MERSKVLARPQPVLVVIDTQAQCTLAYEENSNTEMAKAVNHLTSLSQRSDACVLTVHHSGHLSDGRTIRGRGASAVYAAADTELTITPKEDNCDGLKVPYVELSATKQKDMPTGTFMTLQPTVITIEGAADWKNRPVTSVVMEQYQPLEKVEDSLSAEEWAKLLIRTGITTAAKNRTDLAEQAMAAGVSLPKRASALQPIQNAHKDMTVTL